MLSCHCGVVVLSGQLCRMIALLVWASLFWSGRWYFCLCAKLCECLKDALMWLRSAHRCHYMQSQVCCCLKLASLRTARPQTEPTLRDVVSLGYPPFRAGVFMHPGGRLGAPGGVPSGFAPCATQLGFSAGMTFLRDQGGAHEQRWTLSRAWLYKWLASCLVLCFCVIGGRVSANVVDVLLLESSRLPRNGARVR